MQTNTDLTLYSKSVQGRTTEVWTRTVIENVHWETRLAANQASTGLIDANKFRIYVPVYNRKATIEALSIKEGDVVVEGIVTKTISSEYGIKDLKSNYGEVGVVKSVDKKYFGSPRLQHIEIGAT